MLLCRSSVVRVAQTASERTLCLPGSGASFMGSATILLGREVISSVGHPGRYPGSPGRQGSAAGSIEVSPCRPGGSGVGLCLPGRGDDRSLLPSPREGLGCWGSAPAEKRNDLCSWGQNWRQAGLGI
jgi:hypothetical protein